MTREEARKVFLARGYVEVEGGTIYNPDKWRESCHVISEWLEQTEQTDVLNALNNIKRDVFNACSDIYHMPVYKLDCDEIFGIIDKYMAESEE